MSCLNYFGLLELSANIYKYEFKNLFNDAFAGSLVKTLLSRDIFVTSTVDLKLNFKCGHTYRKKRLCLFGDSSNAFPGKSFVQYKLILN